MVMHLACSVFILRSPWCDSVTHFLSCSSWFYPEDMVKLPNCLGSCKRVCSAQVVAVTCSSAVLWLFISPHNFVCVWPEYGIMVYNHAIWSVFQEEAGATKKSRKVPMPSFLQVVWDPWAGSYISHAGS